MHLLLIAIALLLSLRAPARGDDSLSLAEVIAAALSHNPALQAARARVDAARAVPAQVAAYADPKLSYEAFNVPNSLRLDRAENNIFQVSQAIPFPGKRGLAGTVAKHDAEAMASGLRSLELDTVAMVKRAYYDLWLADARRQLYERDRVLGQRLTRLAEQRYATAEVSQADVLQAQVELSRLINRTMTARLAIASAAAELNAMLSRPPNQALDLPEIPDIPPIEQPLAHWVELALQQRPELEAQRALLARESSNVELARKQYYPDFEVT
ncbi:MAG TPA: TolC family protein, partial [Terriglobales bacterium]|nr:TolC family protein [Terriglobales bacterium]